MILDIKMSIEVSSSRIAEAKEKIKETQDEKEEAWK